MMSQPLPSRIQQAREQWLQRRDECRRMHGAGASSLQVVSALSTAVDEVITRLTSAVAEELGGGVFDQLQSGMALVALAGYGRKEQAPFSDIDLLFLYKPACRFLAENVSGQLVRDLWDTGLVLGSSLRTTEECLALAAGDLSIHTALLEARHILGNRDLTDHLRVQIHYLSKGRRCNGFIDAALAARAAEQGKFGASIHLLEPDLKKSKGGLRELHLLRWVAHARYGIADIDHLERDNLLTAEDAAVVTQARQLLLQVRNDLHFQAGQAQDMMTLDEQVRLASVFGFSDRPGMRAVEQFMQQHYRRCDALNDVVERFVNRSRARSFWQKLIRTLSRKRVGLDYVVIGGEITPMPRAEAETLGSLERIVRLFLLANQHGVTPSLRMREKIRTALPQLEVQDSAAACRTFMEMLAEPGRLGRTLQDMHNLGVLEQVIPEFAHARGLIQFNQYHKYTVDEHTLLGVANAETFLKDKGPLGQVYRGIHHKEILHLALLLHDLGKGYGGDHSEVGRDIAGRTAERFGLEAHLRDVLVLLVHQHLLMAHLAFRRDTSDERVLAELARKAGTPEVLSMLFVLTAADITSVGPETWTSWKADVLADLYARTMHLLTGNVTVLHASQRAEEVQENVKRKLAGTLPEAWIHKHLETMKQHYLLTTPVEQIVEHLRTIHTLPAGGVVTTASYNSATRTTVYTVYTFDSITPGLFSKITGVLAARGLQILSAQIITLQDGVAIDRFEVIDYDYNGEPPRSREADVGETIRQVLLGQRTVEGLFTHRYRIGPASRPTPATHLDPVKVEIDNETSDRFTIIEVFAHDKQGLLYVIAATIFALGLSVAVAKITTSLDQVLDVFYVTDSSGHKVTGEAGLDHIRLTLAEGIEQFERKNGTNHLG